jgi:hypothetical protein
MAYYFMVNGQNGRVAGSLPASRGKAWKYRALHIGAWGALFTAVFCIFVRFFEIYVPMLVPIALAWAAATAAGLFTSGERVKVWEDDMDNTMADSGAFDYIVPGSFLYSEKEDEYLCRTYDRTSPNAADDDDFF